MVGNCFTVCVFCIGGALLSLLLKQYCSEQSILLSASVCATVFTASILLLETPLEEIKNILSSSDIPESYISVLFKSIGISCITHISSELCRDSGETAMGAAAELWGRGALIAISMPVVKGFIELVGSFM
ncbi:MAG: hypothetical protein J6Y81_01300 [Ruminococcus sp.]|nr:SpoIIIAC/SpoIIIAD family protein [Ruminococcus sp.]MBP5430927.1 hypothetical protein [Ruminococcus sp.]